MNTKIKGEQEILEQYFYDIYGLLLKRLSSFMLAENYSMEDGLKLEGLLHEIVKVKKLIATYKPTKVSTSRN